MVEMHGREPEDRLVGIRRDDVFLEQQLQRVGDGLQQAVRADAHGAQAHLEIRQHFALHQHDVAGHQREGRDDDQGHQDRHEQRMVEDRLHMRLPEQRRLREPQERLGIDADGEREHAR